MNRKVLRKKVIERRALKAAIKIGKLIPEGKINWCREEPDFEIQTLNGMVGVEVSDLMPLPNNEFFRSPVEENKFNAMVVQLAEQEYDRTESVKVGVQVHFGKISERRKPNAMAREIAAFVAFHRAEVKNFRYWHQRTELPLGLDMIAIQSRYDWPWSLNEHWSRSLETLIPQLKLAIAKKNQKVPTYRMNLPNAPIYLLLYTCAAGHRDFPLFADMDQLPVRFDFDRVFFYSVVNRTVLELRKGVWSQS